MPLLNPFRMGILRKIDNKGKTTINATLKGFISKARANSESKLISSKSSFNFVTNTVVFCTLFALGYTVGRSGPYNPWYRC